MSRLTFLGTSGSVVTDQRMCSGLLFGDKLIDVGFGVLTNLLRLKVPLNSINDVYVSHTHSDHIGDFTGLVWAMAQDRRTRPLRVISSSSTADSLQRILDLQSTPYAFVKFAIEFLRPHDVDVKSFVTIHDPENLAYRLQTDRGDVVYVGDTARSLKLSEFARDCHLLIHDSTFLDGQESIAAVTRHSTAREAASTAALARARKLVLTHLSPSNAGKETAYLDQASSEFMGPTIVANDLQSIEL